MADDTVTNKDLNDKILRVLIKLEGIDTRNLNADAIHKDHEVRIRLLERWRYALPVSLVLTVLVSGIDLYSRIKGR